VSDSDTFKLTSLTLEAWIYITGLPYEPQNFFGVAAVFFRGDDRGGLDPLSILIKPNGHLEFNVQAPDGQLTVLEAPVMTNQWIHVAGTLEDTTGAMKLYLNGTLAAETVTSGRPVTDLIGANPGVGIGNSQPGSSFRFPFNGLIDELRLYSRALSQQEIQGIYTAKAICHLSLDIQLYPGLTIVGPVGSSYHLQYTEGLSSTNAWYALTNFVLPTSPYFFLDTTVSGKERRYYRAFLLP
jgi:hypothetical protein